MSDVFEKTSEFLEKYTSFTRLQSRGTIRLTLKGANLDPQAVEKTEMIEALKSHLPAELEKRGVEGGAEITGKVVADVERTKFADTAYDVFKKI
ncbi:MAG: hypothetical protein JSU92_00635 [Deltaproteobacteria bacterium]|nr:MAG: hypothetical protein JSU92_00635 [Deltaproteobacteria bacterium]